MTRPAHGPATLPRLDQYESLSPAVNRLVWACDRLGSVLRRPPPALLNHVRFEQARRILLLRCDGIGDLICSVPAIHALCRAYPHAEIDLMVGPWNTSLARMIDGPRTIIPHAPWGYRMLRTERGPIGFTLDITMRRQIRQKKYDAAVDLRGDILSMVPMWTWGIPARAGRIARGGAFCATHPIPESGDRNAHEIDRTLRVARLLGGPTTDRQPRLRVPDEAKQKARELLAQHHLDPQRVVLLCPFAQWIWKYWPVEHWTALIRWLQGLGFQPVISGAASNTLEATQMASSSSPSPVVLCGQANLETLAGLFAISRAFVAVDSGPAHVAAATGAQGVVLFGSSDPQRFGPVSESVRLLQKTQCPLYPCYQRGDCGNQQDWCMRRITPAHLQSTLVELLAL